METNYLKRIGLVSQYTKLEKNLTSSEEMISHPFSKQFLQLLVDKISTIILLLVNDIGGEVVFPLKSRFQVDKFIVNALITGCMSICVAKKTIQILHS